MKDSVFYTWQNYCIHALMGAAVACTKPSQSTFHHDGEGHMSSSLAKEDIDYHLMADRRERRKILYRHGSWKTDHALRMAGSTFICIDATLSGVHRLF